MFTDTAIPTPVTLLRTEGLALLAAAIGGYFALGGGWGWFLGLLLVPDVALAAYLVGPRFGAVAYNAAHSTIGPALLAVVGLATGGASSVLLLGALIWFAHVGLDRAFGYGLKHASGFRDTHLGRVGREAAHYEPAQVSSRP